MTDHLGAKPGVTRTRRPRDERAAEAPAMLIVIPVLMVLVLALIDVGFSLRTRMLVENVARDAARGAAADGGNFNPRTQDGLPSGGWQQIAMNQLTDGYGNCTFAACTDKPEVVCTPQIASHAGEMVHCSVTYYPKAINKDLLDSPIGLGMGSLVPETIEVDAYARAETGYDG